MIERFLCPEGLLLIGLFLGGLVGWRASHPHLPMPAAICQLLMAGSLAAFVWLVPAAAQPMDREEAETEAEDLAEGLEEALEAETTGTVDGDRVPGFTTDDPPETSYHGDAYALESDGYAASLLHDEALAVQSSIASRPIVTPEELATWTANGLAIEADARSIVSEYGGTYGDCTVTVEGGSEVTYSYSCNEGETLIDYQASCDAALLVTIPVSYVHECSWVYLDGDLSWEPDAHCVDIAAEPSCGPLTPAGGGSCSPTRDGERPTCTERYFRATCDVPEIAGVPAVQTIKGDPEESWDARSCASHEADPNCVLLSEVCTAPDETRPIDGVPVTRACWNWERTYQCQGLGGTTTDCVVPPECTLQRSECLSTDPDSGDCRTFEHTYQCTVPGSDPAATGYCDEDVYCIAGDCNSVTRPQNDEFADAVSALGALRSLAEDVDPDTLEIFPGSFDKCDQIVGGLKNCCSNDGLLTDLGLECSAEERALADQQKAGLCHYVGTYCRTKTLFGICLKKRKTFCCFQGVLARLIHEQGRPQVGWDWGSTKTPDCSGFPVALFQAVDLSQMDFSEFYDDVLADFVLPGGEATADAITTRIIETYACPPNC